MPPARSGTQSTLLVTARPARTGHAKTPANPTLHPLTSAVTALTLPQSRNVALIVEERRFSAAEAATNEGGP
jgi:hypothetical protein